MRVPGVIQRAVGFELEVNVPVSAHTAPDDNIGPAARAAANDWTNARIALPEADPHAVPPVPQTVIYHAANGGITVDAVPDKRRLPAGMPRQIVEIRVSPIDTASTVGLAGTMANVTAGITPLYNGITVGTGAITDPQQYRFRIPGGGPAMVGLPNGADPTGTFNPANRATVSWSTYMQATAGIKPDRLRQTFRVIQHGAQVGDDPSYTSLRSPVARHRAIAGAARAAALAAYNVVNAAQPNPADGNVAAKEKVLGLLTLIASYLYGGSERYLHQGNLNPKNMAPLFSRSSFARMRLALPTTTRIWVNNNYGAFEAALIGQTRTGTVTDNAASALFNRAMPHPTVTTQDFLEGALHTGHADNYTARESKTIIPREQVTPGQKGGVHEFRNIATPGATVGAWVTKMTEVVTAIHHLNA